MPIALSLAAANRNDHLLLRETIEAMVAKRPDTNSNLCLDAGYNYDSVRALLVEFGFTAHIRSRADEAAALKREAGYRARRWVVERTHSWMNRFRSILVRWEKKGENFLGLLHLSCAWITFKQAGLLG